MGPIFLLFFGLKYVSSETPLAREVTPSHYEIMWSIEECEFSGRVAIDIDVNNATKHFELHTGSLILKKDSIRLEKMSSEISGLEVEERMDENGCGYFPIQGKKLKLSLRDPLEVGSKYKLYLDFQGEMMSHASYGFFCQRYVQNNQTKWLASTSLEPMYARTAFPCFDEPGLKANFTISVAHDKNHTAISNMPLSTSVASDLGENWVLDTFQTTPKMSTYLVGVHVSEFENIETKLDDKPIRLWADSEGIKYGDFSLEMTSKVLSFLENHTGIKDPMPKQDFIAIENYTVGGLEKWGLVSYQKSAILLSEKHNHKFSASDLIGHELAHSYFGNLVSINSWGDLWLKEGFATYYGALSIEKIYPEEMDYYWSGVRNKAMGADSDSKSHPLRTKNELECFYDDISYEKGSLILRMLNFTLGEEVLREGVSNYLKSNAFALASHESLWENLEKAALKANITFPEGVNLEQIMDSWINVPGYPLITVNRNHKSGEITLTQRSIIDKENKVDESGWFIPLSYKYEGENETPRIWLDPRQPNLTIKDTAPSKFVLFDPHRLTYARVRYDRNNIELMKQNGAELNAGVIADTTELTRLGFAPVVESLDTWLLLDKTSPYQVKLLSDSAFKMLSYLEDTELYSFYKEFLSMLTQMGDVNDESQRMEIFALACKVGVEWCLEMGKQKFDRWAEDSNNDISQDIRYAVLCLGISEGDAKTWKMVFDRSGVNDIQEKDDILNSLACSNDEQILLEYFPSILNVTSKTADISAVFAERHPDLFLNHMEKMDLPLEKREWQKLFEVLASKVNSQKRLKQFQKLLTANSFVSQENAMSLMAMAKKKVAWMESDKKDSETWIRNYLRMQSR